MKNYERKYYTIYHTSEDITFIMCEESDGKDILYVEVVGFHYGEPDNHSFEFIEKRKAEFAD